MQDIYEISPKFGRAHENLKVFKAESLKYLESEPQEFPIEFQPKGNGTEIDVIMRIQFVKPVPPILSVLAGDILYEIRSALDHLVFALSDSYSVRTLRKTIDLDKAGTEFPIFVDPAKFGELRKDRQPAERSGLHKIRLVHPDVQAIIESLQPYNARNHTRLEFLWVLQQLCNIDKHRRLNILGPPLGNIRLKFSLPVRLTKWQMLAKRPLEDGAIIGCGSFIPLASGEAEVTMIRDTFPEVVIEDAFERRFIRYNYAGWLLEDILDFVELEVLPKFAPFL